MIQICSQTGTPSSSQACQYDSQCKSDVCYQSKCIDNVCQTSPLPNIDNPLCCSSTADCPDNPCTEKFCNVETYRCFYQTIKGCEVSDYTEPYIIVSYSSNNSSGGGSSSSYQPTSGDIAGAIIGFIILGILVVAFIIVIFMMLVQKLYKKVVVKKEPK